MTIRVSATALNDLSDRWLLMGVEHVPGWFAPEEPIKKTNPP